MVKTDDERAVPPTPSAFALAADPRALAEKEAVASDEAADGDPRISLEHVEGRMRQSVARRVIELIRSHPDLAAAVVRGWMRQR